MVRVKRGNIARKNRKKYLILAKGFRGNNSKLSTFAKEQVVQSLFTSYIGRKLKKRNFRKIWIYRINAIARFYNINYSILLGNLRKHNILFNRKILAFFSFQDIAVFKILIRYIFSK